MPKRGVGTRRFRPARVRRRRGILVAGMHRSGTSALARVLGLLGCDLPATLMPANASNEAGYWESTAIQQLNDRILESAGTNWQDWREFYPEWFQSPKASQFRDEALALLNSQFGTSHLFVLKDPRLCRLLPFWLDVFDEAEVEPLVLSPVRNPLEVAASLTRRNGFDSSYSTLLWLRHVLDAERASRGAQRFFTSYEGLLTDWRTFAQKAQTKLGVIWPSRPEMAAAEINAFLSPSLQHHRVPDEALFDNPAVSGWLVRAYKILAGWARTGERKDEMAALDRIRQEFDAASPALSQLIAAERKASGVAKSAAAELSQAREKLTKAEASLTGEATRVSRFAQELTAVKAASAEKDKQITALTGDAALKAQAAERALASLADINTRLQQVEAARASEAARAQRFEQELTAAKAASAEKDKRIATLTGDAALKAEKAQASFAEVNTRLQQAEAARTNIEKEISAARASLAEKDKRIATLASDAALKAQAVEKVQASLAEISARLEQAAAAYASEAERASRIEQELSAARVALLENDKRVSALVSDLTLKTQAAEVAQAGLVDAGTRLQQAESEQWRQSQRAAQFERELGTAKSQLVQKDERIAALVSELTARIETAEQAQSNLGAIAERLELAERRRADESQRNQMLEQALAALRSEIAERDRRIALLTSEAAQERQAAAAMEARLADTGKQEARRAAELEQKVDALVLARDKAEAELAEARSRLAQTESALLQRRHEADQTAEELARAQAELAEMAARQARNEKVLAGLEQHVQLLVGDRQERQSQIAALEKKLREQEPAVARLKQLLSERDRRIAQLDVEHKKRLAEHAKAMSQLEEREKTITQLQAEQKEHLDEMIKLSQLAIEREKRARVEAEKAETIRDVAAKELGRTVAALLDNRRWSLLPKKVRVKQQMALLKRAGLFDAEWYLQHYHDVRESGMDPLRHYVEYGAREGRGPNAKFEPKP